MKDRVHLIGIGGAGISAIARVLLERGVDVTGSDREESEYSRALQVAGVTVFYGHAAANVSGAGTVVASSAIPDDNIELKAAADAGIPVFRRPAYLKQIMKDHRVIAVAGTHGKTTTSGMAAWILASAGRDPSFIVGGMLPNFGTNAHAGKGADFVIEADEYAQTFLALEPSIALITNVEHDHPDCYPTLADCLESFNQFAGRVKDVLIVCADNPGSAGLRAGAVRRVTYGEDPAAAWCLRNVATNAFHGMDADVIHKGETIATLQTRISGRHNLMNALGALVIAIEAGIEIGPACEAIRIYQGPARRFQILGEAGGVTVIDDYAHHPTEIRATLSAARERYPDAVIWAVFQPHTYSRTRTLLRELAGSFEGVDHVLVTRIFAAREMPDGITTGAQVAAELAHVDAVYTAELDDALQMLQAGVLPGDVVITLSAGDANRVGMDLLAWLEERRGDHPNG